MSNKRIKISGPDGERFIPEAAAMEISVTHGIPLDQALEITKSAVEEDMVVKRAELKVKRDEGEVKRKTYDKADE